MKEMKDLNRLAMELKEKNTWVRKGLGVVMSAIGDLDCDEIVSVAVCDSGGYPNMTLWIRTGSSDVACTYDYSGEDEFEDPCPDAHWWLQASMKEVRRFVGQLPRALFKMRERMLQNRDCKIPQSLRPFFDALNEEKARAKTSKEVKPADMSTEEFLRYLSSNETSCDAAVELSRRLHDAMAANSISRYDLSAISGLSVNVVDRALTCDRLPDAAVFAKLLDAARAKNVKESLA